jgi:hypothetical protein
MTHQKLLLELSGILSAFEEESSGRELISMSLQILPEGQPDLAGPIYVWDGRQLVELEEGMVLA